METAKITIPSGLHVMIGMPIGRDLPARTASALFETAKACQATGIGTTLSMHAAVTQLARDMIFADFLNSTADLLFWIDSDMVWTPDEFMRIVALASQRKHFVGVAYPAKSPGKNEFYISVPNGAPIEEFGLVRAIGYGMGFCAHDRLVAEAIAATKPEIGDSITGRRYRSVFRFDMHNGNFRSEDMAFMADVAAAGFDVWLDPAVTLGHVGNFEWRGSLAEAVQIIDDGVGQAAE